MDSSKLIQHFFKSVIYDCGSSTEPKFDSKNVINIVKSTTYLVHVVIERWSKTVENKSIKKNHQIQNK